MLSPLVEINRRLFPCEQVRELDRIAIEENNVPGSVLMERAGETAWKNLIETWPCAEKICIICGTGNNAGDGYVVAMHGLACNKLIELVAMIAPDKLQGDAGMAAKKFLATGHAVHTSIAEINLDDADVIVDAMLGTGLDRNIEGDFLNAIEKINESTKPVVSLDIPSGLNANTGIPMGIAVKADLTVSFVGQKQGLYLGQSADYRGKVIFDSLSISPELYQQLKMSSQLVDVSCYSHLLPTRTRTAHKGNYGHVLVLGGDYGLAGAVRMCGEAAARSGAGLISIATRPEHAFALPGTRPELMALGVKDGAGINPLLDNATVIAIGPGLGQSDWSRSLFSRALDTDLPLVVDADALNLLAQDPISRENWILTPHPGEAARLLECNIEEIQTNRLHSAIALQEKFGGVIVLKGSGSIICNGPTQVFICAEGNPGMATGGMGDVLTGIISSLMAQGLDPVDAAAFGVSLHSRAADLSAAGGGERGLLATDLLLIIRQLVNHQG